MINDKVVQVRGNDLKAKSVRGMMSLTAGTGVEKGLRFLRYAILARLLIPEELGLMALIIALALSFEAFTEVGIKQSIIQNKRGSEAAYLNVAWWFQCIRGLGLYGLGFLVAPWICQFYFHDRSEILSLYGQSELEVLLRVSFLSILFNCLISPRAHVLEKEFRFSKVVFLLQGSGVVGTLLTIVSVFILRNVWALVIGFTSEVAFRCLLSYVICPFRPLLTIDRESFRDLFKFARGMFGLAILTYVTMQIDVLVLSKVVSSDKVGLYSWALALAVVPREFFRRIIVPLIVPAFSKKQGDKEFLCKGVVTIAMVVSMLCMPFIAFVLTCSDSILSVLYGPRFSAVALPFALLCISSVVLIQGTPLAGVCFALGKPQVHRRYAAIRALLLMALIYPAALFFGLSGTALVVLLSNLGAFVMQVHWVSNLIGLKLRAYALSWMSGMRLSVLVFIVGLLLRFFAGTSDVVNLIVVGLVCLVVCLLNIFRLSPLRNVSQSPRQILYGV